MEKYCWSSPKRRCSKTTNDQIVIESIFRLENWKFRFSKFAETRKKWIFIKKVSSRFCDRKCEKNRKWSWFPWYSLHWRRKRKPIFRSNKSEAIKFSIKLTKKFDPFVFDVKIWDREKSKENEPCWSEVRRNQKRFRSKIFFRVEVVRDSEDFERSTNNLAAAERSKYSFEWRRSTSDKFPGGFLFFFLRCNVFWAKNSDKSNKAEDKRQTKRKSRRWSRWEDVRAASKFFAAAEFQTNDRDNLRRSFDFRYSFRIESTTKIRQIFFFSSSRSIKSERKCETAARYFLRFYFLSKAKN